ncbi:MAG: T9SS type A sorting domain-containing protein [Flavobacteriales bacterium]|jgi:hypothetical protein|nr:T9SS type A sorting domain-containing protein [Flavobacteriales bacterium]
MLKRIILASFTLSSWALIGQEVIAPAGNAFNNGGTHLYWTIGETVVSTEDDGNNIITQGFHQPQVTVSTVEEQLTTTFSIFPTPVTNILTIKASKANPNTTAFISDLNGKSVRSFLLTELTTQLNIEELSSGIYLLTIKEDDTMNTYKIIKK